MRNLKRMLALAMACIFVTTTFKINAYAEVPDERLLWAFQPMVPKLQAQYPATVTLSTASGTVTFKGTVGTRATMTDAQTVQAIKDAVKDVPEYKAIDDAYADKLLVNSLTQSLEFGSDDIDRIKNNLAKILGVDSFQSVVNYVSPINIPSIPTGDNVNIVTVLQSIESAGETAHGIYEWAGTIRLLKDVGIKFKDIAGGLKPGAPNPLSIIMNGAGVSFEEFERDQKKYADLVELLNAKERLRRFQKAVLSNLYHNINPVYVIDVGGTVQGEAYVDDGTLCPALYSLQLVAYKDDGENYFTGSYSGSLIVNVDVDTTSFDAEYAQRLADAMNGARKGTAGKITALAEKRPSDDLVYEVVYNSGEASSVYTHYKSESFKVTIPNRAADGKSTTTLDPMQLTVVDMDNLIDRHAKIKAENETVKHEISIDSYTNKTGYYFYEDSWHVVQKVPPYNEEFANNPEDGTYPDMDTRPYLIMELMIDSNKGNSENNMGY